MQLSLGHWFCANYFAYPASQQNTVRPSSARAQARIQGWALGRAPNPGTEEYHSKYTIQWHPSTSSSLGALPWDKSCIRPWCWLQQMRTQDFARGEHDPKKDPSDCRTSPKCDPPLRIALTCIPFGWGDDGETPSSLILQHLRHECHRHHAIRVWNPSINSHIWTNKNMPVSSKLESMPERRFTQLSTKVKSFCEKRRERAVFEIKFIFVKYTYVPANKK